MSKCGSLEWTDAPYNPRASVLTRSIQHPAEGQGLALNLIMTDSRTAVVEAARLIGLGTAFSQALIEATERLREDPMTFNEVNASINATFARYTTWNLVEMASHCFKVK